ncbi:MAG: FAD-dependent oxidoreductase [Ilumatobacteraceae bacterium]|nr:FAD-dependent oxidoreductase [Ilumatobacteraceae bacterium]
MSEVPSHAKVVVIGAGIVGNCLVGHLSRLGWTDMVLLDKGPLPNPGGSTGHASNFIFPTDHNKEMAFLTVDSQNQYIGLGLNNTCGGIEVARTPERMHEFTRRMTSAKAWGIDARLVTPAEIKEMVPFINEEILLGGYYTPSVSVVDSLASGTSMREEAVAKGALQVFANTEVLDIETTPVPGGLPKVTAVVTNKGRIECEYVAIACGVWSPRIAEMAGATIPLTPAVHQMADVGPIDVLVESNKELAFPIIRDMDTFCYERQSAGSMEVGSYAHRPILMRPDDIPSNEAAALTPTELPLTYDDFEPQMEQAIELMEMLGDAEIKYAINGLLSLTPDANPVLGECVEVRNLWSAAAVWIKEGPGIAQLVAEWMTYGYPHMCDPHGSDISRFYPHEKTEWHINARCNEHFNKTYGIVHPREQWASQRGMRRSPFYAREEALGAVFFDARGWERPQWYESNAGLMEKYPEACQPRQHEWDARWWSPITNAEHLAMRESVGMVDLTAFNEFDFEGPGACDFLNWVCVNNVDVAVGRSVYTPLLTPQGGFRGDLTIQRLGTDHFRVITGAFDGGRDHYWFTKHMEQFNAHHGPQGKWVTFNDMSGAMCTIGVWGPNAAATMAKIATDHTTAAYDVSQEGFPYGAVRDVLIGGVPCTMFRISYVGDNGWEIYTRMEHGLKLWDAIAAAGQEFGIIPVGIGVYALTGRIEKGYRLMGSELESEYNPVEAGLARPKVKSADFIGKEAYLSAREESPAAIMCTLSMDSQRCAEGYDRFPTGGNEPILTLSGERILDRKGRVSRVTTAGAAPSLGKYLLMAYLPPEHAVVGTKLQMMYMNELYPVTVEVAGSTPLFDPTDARMKS